LAALSGQRWDANMGDGLFNVMGAIVTVALVTTIVSRETSATVIRAMGDAFSGSIRAALGK
jgi:hypothetical protein